MRETGRLVCGPGRGCGTSRSVSGWNREHIHTPSDVLQCSLVFGGGREAVVVVGAEEERLAQLNDSSTTLHLSLCEGTRLCIIRVYIHYIPLILSPDVF